MKIDEIILIKHSYRSLKKNKNLDQRFLSSYSTYIKTLSDSLTRLSYKFTSYNNPKSFIKRISKHNNPIVLSIWGVGGSRNKKSLIPSICETNRIPYVGGDTHIQAICQDKHLSNLYAKEHGISVPKQVLYTNNRFVNYRLELSRLRFPVLVKPIIEGESIGISDSNVCNNPIDALQLAQKLYNEFSQDIIIEELLNGKEINVVIAGINSNIDIYTELCLEHSSIHPDKLYSFDKKRVVDQSGLTTQINSYLDDDTKQHIINLFNDLKHAELLRVDGILENGEFKLIEFTQDPGLAFGGTIHKAFKQHGFTYDEMLEYLLHNARNNCEKY